MDVVNDAHGAAKVVKDGVRRGLLAIYTTARGRRVDAVELSARADVEPVVALVSEVA